MGKVLPDDPQSFQRQGLSSSCRALFNDLFKRHGLETGALFKLQTGSVLRVSQIWHPRQSSQTPACRLHSRAWIGQGALFNSMSAVTTADDRDVAGTDDAVRDTRKIRD